MQPTVNIGGVAGTVTYAGFVSGSVAGLYQINVQLPASTGNTLYPNYPLTSSPINAVTAPVQLPVQVKVGTYTSQSNVTVWVAPRLLVVGPTGSALDATIGSAYSGQVTAYEGTGTISYVLQSGVLPSGLTLSPSTGPNLGNPSGRHSRLYQVTIGATDSASPAVAWPARDPDHRRLRSPDRLRLGHFTVRRYLRNGQPGSHHCVGKWRYRSLYLRHNPRQPGRHVDQSVWCSQLITLNAGWCLQRGCHGNRFQQYPSLTATVSFTINVALEMTTTIAPTTQASADSTGVLAQVTATGNTGTVTYALDHQPNAGLAIDSNGNITVGTAPDATYSVTVTATDGGTAPGATGNVTGTSTISVTVAN